MKKQLSIPRVGLSTSALIKQHSNLTNIVPDSLRIHCICVRLNNAELNKLNPLR